MAKENFIPAAADDWYQRRRTDEEGQFFRKFAAREDHSMEETKQGTYVVTSGGKRLGYNNNQSRDRRLAMMREALAAWRALSPEDRNEGFDPGKAEEKDPTYGRQCPANGLAIQVSTRCLDWKDSALCRWVPDQPVERGTRTSSDHMWLRPDDIQRLATALESAEGKPIELDQRLAFRLLRFHCVDNTRGEPKHWSRDEIRSHKVRLSPHGAGRWSMDGSAKLASEKDVRGFEARLSGEITLRNGQITGWNMLVLGEHWGDSKFTRGARPGKTPLGIAFRLLADDDPDRAIPPQGIRWEKGYYEAEKH